MTKLAKLQKKADSLLQELVKKKHPKCLVCGKKTHCGHHFFPKSLSSALRYEKSNMIEICCGCHFAHHTRNDPTIHIIILFKKGFDWYNNLIDLKNKKPKINIAYYEAIIKKLQNEINRKKI